MKNEKYLYILLTKTPLKTGKIIRKVTGYEYNHVSISLDNKLHTFYSFSRKHKNTTFYAGLVTESSLRYKNNIKVKIFRIPLTNKLYKDLNNYLQELKIHKDEYLYNLLSCITAPFHKKIKVKKAFTCCEFAVHILNKYFDFEKINTDGYFSIEELSSCLDKYLIYEGIFYTDNKSWGEDKYLEKKNIIVKYYKTVKTNGTLTYRFLKGFLIR